MHKKTSLYNRSHELAKTNDCVCIELQRSSPTTRESVEPRVGPNGIRLLSVASGKCRPSSQTVSVSSPIASRRPRLLLENGTDE